MARKKQQIGSEDVQFEEARTRALQATVESLVEALPNSEDSGKLQSVAKTLIGAAAEGDATEKVLTGPDSAEGDTTDDVLEPGDTQ